MDDLHDSRSSPTTAVSEKCEIKVLLPTPVRPITAMTVSSGPMSGTTGSGDETSWCEEDGELAGIGLEGPCPML